MILLVMCMCTLLIGMYNMHICVASIYVSVYVASIYLPICVASKYVSVCCLHICICVLPYYMCLFMFLPSSNVSVYMASKIYCSFHKVDDANSIFIPLH